LKSNRSLSDIAALVLSNEAKQGPEPSAQSRVHAIAAIARAMRLRKRRQRIRVGAIGATAVAAAIALAVGFGRVGHRAESGSLSASGVPVPAAAASFVRGSPTVVRHGARMPLSDGTALEKGDRLLVEHGSRATVAMANGTYLLLEEAADLVLTSPAPATSFELAAGSVRADVAKLKPHERFVIHTADAEVEVHGTSFEVSRVDPDPACGRGTTTRVKVREGVVSVRAHGTETFVHPNEVWPSGCAATASSPATTGTLPTSAPAASTREPAQDEVAAPPSPKRAAEAPASSLAAQNDLFERAIARKRAGDPAGAVAALDDLLARYPSSHLAQSARAERMKLLRGIDPKRARAAARDYLDRYPSGFARHDAELIVAGE